MSKQWNVGTAAHTARKFRVQKYARKIVASMFWYQDGILPIDYLSKSQTNSMKYSLSLLM